MFARAQTERWELSHAGNPQDRYASPSPRGSDEASRHRPGLLVGVRFSALVGIDLAEIGGAVCSDFVSPFSAYLRGDWLLWSGLAPVQWLLCETEIG